MARTHGRAPRGERLIGVVPHGHWHTTTFLCGLRHDGLIAPLVLDGAINGEVFLAYVKQFLVPTLRPGPGGRATLPCSAISINGGCKVYHCTGGCSCPDGGVKVYRFC